MDENKTSDETSAGDSVEHQQTNAIGPSGVTADNNVGIIVSGQPAGGPDNLGKKAHDEAE